MWEYIQAIFIFILGATAGAMFGSSIACWIGKHNWQVEYQQLPNGSKIWYEKCKECGYVRRIPVS